MDGKIPILSRLLILSLLFFFFANSYADTDYNPGDVVFISLNENESSMNFYYNRNLATKVLKDNRHYLLFGIPYYTKEGKNEFIFKSEKIIKKVSLNILRKKYPIQKIEIKKFKTKDIVMTYGPTAEGRITLNKLNEMIAKEKGVKVSELAVQEDKQADAETTKKTTKKADAKETAKK